MNEFALEPHDGTPLSVLKALRRHLDGFNPDRAQVEKQRIRPAIIMALQRLRAQDAHRYSVTRSLFPGIGAESDHAALDRDRGTSFSGLGNDGEGNPFTNLSCETCQKSALSDARAGPLHSPREARLPCCPVASGRRF